MVVAAQKLDHQSAADDSSASSRARLAADNPAGLDCTVHCNTYYALHALSITLRIDNLGITWG